MKKTPRENRIRDDQKLKQSISTSTNQRSSRNDDRHKIRRLDVTTSEQGLLTTNTVRLITAFVVCLPLMPLILPLAGFIFLDTHLLGWNVAQRIFRGLNPIPNYEATTQYGRSLPITVSSYVIDDNNKTIKHPKPSIFADNRLHAFIKNGFNADNPSVIMIPDLGRGISEYKRVIKNINAGKYNLCVLSKEGVCSTEVHSIQEIIQAYTEIYFNLREYYKYIKPDMTTPPNITLVGHGMSGGLAAKVMLNILKIDKDAKVKLLTYNTPNKLDSGFINYTCFTNSTIQSSIILSSLTRIITKIICVLSDIRLLDCHKNMQLLKENFSNAKNAAVASFNNPSDTTIGNETLQNKEKDFDYNIVNAKNNLWHKVLKSPQMKQEIDDAINEDLNEQHEIEKRILETLDINKEELVGFLSKEELVLFLALSMQKELPAPYKSQPAYIAHQCVDLNLQPIRDFIHDKKSSSEINRITAASGQETAPSQGSAAASVYPYQPQHKVDEADAWALAYSEQREVTLN
ncbi:hypothetical protein GUI12_04055 [Anaplasmataceae bacterium AB001_6]|nr:hypothetical protein GUI12_04055 [Anaplasmataceae bacterium AB001_6]